MSRRPTRWLSPIQRRLTSTKDSIRCSNCLESKITRDQSRPSNCRFDCAPRDGIKILLTPTVWLLPYTQTLSGGMPHFQINPHSGVPVYRHRQITRAAHQVQEFTGMKTKEVILFSLFLATTTFPALRQSAGTKLWEFTASPRI